MQSWFQVQWKEGLSRSGGVPGSLQAAPRCYCADGRGAVPPRLSPGPSSWSTARGGSGASRRLVNDICSSSGRNCVSGRRGFQWSSDRLIQMSLYFSR